MTQVYGAAIFTDITGELAEATIRDEYYPGVGADHDDMIWADWRRPTLAELVQTWPAKQPPSDSEVARGWWQPTLQELRAERPAVDHTLRMQEQYGATNAGQLDMGLLFACFQSDLAAGFLSVQARLNGEQLEEYIKPTGGGYFFVLPGIPNESRFLGQGLLEAAAKA